MLKNNIGDRLIYRAMNIAIDQGKKDIVLNILEPFMFNSNELDLKIISKLEEILDTELYIVPTKNQWRKIKLQHLDRLLK
jgi:hypothetical protein